jgi:hypothetical protein
MGVEEGGAPPEVKIETIDISTKRAEVLYGRYKDQILNMWFGEGEPPEGEIVPDKLIGRYLKRIPPDVLNKYWGHGITRGNELGQLAALINIATNHSIKGWAGRLTESGYGAWTDGSFLILSPRDQDIFVRKDGRPIMIDGERAQANIGAIVVNSYFDLLTEELQAMFPDLKIIKANQLPDYFAEAAQE